MTDEPEEPDPMVQLENEQRFRAKVGEYVHFLLEEGLELFPSEPEPILDEYINRYITDPPSHLSTASEESRRQAAIVAWGAAIRDRERRRAHALRDMLRINFLAASRCMVDIAARVGGWEADRIRDHLETIRLEIVRKHWLELNWREPWVSLVDIEFPGSGPTADDVLRFEQERSTYQEQMSAVQVRVRKLTTEMRDFLWQHCYLPSSNEELLLIFLAGLIEGNAQVRSSVRPSALETRIQVAEKLIELAVDPKHPAWLALLDHYFPIPEEG